MTVDGFGLTTRFIAYFHTVCGYNLELTIKHTLLSIAKPSLAVAW
jgi:hypothetical protein